MRFLQILSRGCELSLSLFRISEEGAGQGRRFSLLSSEEVPQEAFSVAAVGTRTISILMMELGLIADHQQPGLRQWPRDPRGL